MRRRVTALRRRLDASLSPSRRRLVLAFLAFVAVYREAFEVVLFLRALLLDTSGAGSAVAAGGAAALAVLVLGVLLARRVERRLSPAGMLSASGSLLCALALVLAGNGVRSLQEAGAVPIHALGGLRIDWLGVYPTVETLGAQALALATFVAIGGIAWLRARASTGPSEPAPDRATA
jgi:high-affinity iron transporter